MSANEIHKTDVGTILRITVKEDSVALDISSATTTLMICKPDNTVTNVTPSFYTNGTDGVIVYTLTAAILSLAGKYTLQVHVDFGSTEFYSEVYEFQVYDNIGSV